MAHQEEIARLTGKLVFQADTGPLRNLMTMMENANKKLNGFALNFEKLSRVTSKKFKVHVDTKELDRFKAELRSLEGKATQAKIKVGVEKYALDHHKSAAVQSPAKIAAQEARLSRAQAAQAVADKKVAAAQAQVIKNQGLTATIAQKAQAHGAVLTQKAQSLNFQQQRQTQQSTQSAQRHASQQTTAANRHTIQQQQIAKNAHQAANGYSNAKAKPAKKHGGMSTFFGGPSNPAGHGAHGGGFAQMFGGVNRLGTGMGMTDAVSGIVGAFNPVLGALGGFGIAVGAATGLLHLMNEHLDKRQETVTDSEQFVLALKSFSEDPKEQKAMADAYIATNKKYALQTNVETARQYSMQARTLMSVGKTAPQATHMIDSQDAMIRAANMGAQAQGNFKNELNHLIVGGKGSLTGAQWRSLWNALGALGPLVQQQTAAVMGYKGKAEGAAEFLKHNKKQTGADQVYAGMDRAAQMSQGIIDRHTSSVEAKQIDLETTKYLQNVGIETSDSMLEATKDRIAAEEELAKAMLPVNKAWAEFDEWLFRFNSWIIRLMAHAFGKNENADKNTPEAMEKRKQEAADHGGSLAYQGNVVSKDKDGNLVNSDGSANRGLFGDLKSLFGMDKPAEPTTPLLAAPAMPTLQQGPSFPGFAQGIANMQDVIKQNQANSSPSAQQAASTTVNAPINIVNNNTINSTISGASEDKVNAMLEAGLRNNAVMMPQHAEAALKNMLGNARASQAER